MARGEAGSPPIRVLALGGSTRPDSQTERALRIAGAAAQAEGAQVTYVVGRDLMLPIYDTESDVRTPAARALVEMAAAADGLIVASPGYHGGMSGMMKNALDYFEDLRADDAGYLHGRAVGCIAVAFGWQATVSTLQQVRQVVHALRGWPTPFGGAVNARITQIGDDGSVDAEVAEQLALVGRQVVEFAQMRRALAEGRADD